MFSCLKLEWLKNVIASSAAANVSNVVIAFIAACGWMFSPLLKWFFRSKIDFPERDSYQYGVTTVDLRTDTPEADSTVEFLMPLKNAGSSFAEDCHVSVDCILKKKGVGEELELKYCGIPLKMRWPSGKEVAGIVGGDIAYFCAMIFTTEQQMDETPGAQTEDIMTCYLCANNITCNNGGRIPVSSGKPFEIYVHMRCAFKNSDAIREKWFSMKWDGSTTSKDGFLITAVSGKTLKALKTAYNDAMKKGRLA